MRTVKDILAGKGHEVKTIERSQTVFEAILMMDEYHIGSLVVTDSGSLVGVVTERDYACKVTLKGKEAQTTTVGDIMSGRVVVAKLETTLNECMALMTDKRLRHLPIMEGDQLLGLVSIGDVVKEVIDEQNFVIGQLESYIHS